MGYFAKHIHKLCLLLAVLSLASCATSPEKPPKWKHSDFLEKRFSLIHPTEVEDIKFCRNSRMAAVTFGIQNKWLCAPLMYWRVKQNRLEVYGDDGKLYQAFTLVSRGNGKVTVTDLKGEQATYLVE